MQKQSAEPVIKNRDIVIIGLQPWDVPIGSNCKDIALEMSQHNRVLYVNFPLDWNRVLKERKTPGMQKRFSMLSSPEASLVSIQPNLWNFYPDTILFSVNWLNSNRLFSLVTKINNRLFARSIQKAIRRLGFSNVILFNDNDMVRGFYMKELLKPAVSVYYSRDYMLAVPYWKKHGAALEPKIIAKADVCVANSTFLADYCRQYNQRSYYVGQGCDLSLYTALRQETPADVTAIRRPVIGYTGALISFRLDLEILLFIARQKKEWSLVLIGPEDEDFAKSELHHLPNVHFLGSKNAADLPAYIQSFDVCINPQVVSEVTIGNYPRKIDEYLAMKKPVVATKTPAMSAFADHVYLAQTKEEFVALLEKALAEDNPQRQRERRRFAETHTWENNVAEIYKAIEAFESTKGPQG
jgi:glycosyltransferase involved in cell wall biosynthesis